MKYKENFAEKFIKSLMGKESSDIKDNNKKIPGIRKMLEDLINIPDETWGKYAFRREPLNGRFTDEERSRLISESNKCGIEQANKIKEKYEVQRVHEYAEKLGLKVDYPDRPVGGGHIYLNYNLLQ